jgi:ubiquinone/menaquinone biosynthesis C-methylase UbiE
LSWVKSKEEAKVFLDMLSPSPGERILDVGGGKGAVAGFVLEASGGAEVFAIDTDRKRVAAMKVAEPEVGAFVAGAESIPFADSSFDRAYSTMAVHHFTDLERGIRELARVLRSGGRLVVLDVDPSSGMGRLFRFLEGVVMRRRMNFMGAGEMALRLKDAGGFQVMEVRGRKAWYLIRCTRE